VIDFIVRAQCPPMDEKRSKRIKAALERYGMLSPDSVGIHQGDTTRLICRLNDPDRATRLSSELRARGMVVSVGRH
jgi:hypothetical protein